jgi:hypothetical protein
VCLFICSHFHFNYTCFEVNSPSKELVCNVNVCVIVLFAEKLVDHFKKYGEIIDSVIMKDRGTGHPRGFGFVTYSDPSAIDAVLKDAHTLDGRTVSSIFLFIFIFSNLEFGTRDFGCFCKHFDHLGFCLFLYCLLGSIWLIFEFIFE